jgi:hypothetical protein
MRQLTVCRVGHDPEGGKRELMGGCEFGGNMRLRVGCQRAGLQMQGALFGVPCDWSINPGNVGDRHSAERS